MTQLNSDDFANRIRLALDGAQTLDAVEGVFATPEDSSRWWTTPHPELDGLAPCVVAADPHGVVRVRDLLVSIWWGMAA